MKAVSTIMEKLSPRRSKAALLVFNQVSARFPEADHKWENKLFCMWKTCSSLYFLTAGHPQKAVRQRPSVLVAC